MTLLREVAERAPTRPAVVTSTERVSYGDLLALSTARARQFADDGLERGDRVAAWMTNRVAWLELLFATTACGATLVPFSTWSTRDELRFLLKDSAVRWCFAQSVLAERDFREDLESLREETPALERVVFLSEMSEAPPRDFVDRGQPGDPALLLYTSGSSARPKAVPLQHGPAIENGFHIGERQGLSERDAVLVPVPLFWSYGCINALPAILTHGATMVLPSVFEPSQALELIESERCTAIYTLPAITNALISAPAFRPERTASLRTGLTIGTPEDIRRAARELGAKEICNIYGSTECYGNCCVTPHHWPLERRAESQGPPLPGMELRIREAEGGAIEVRGRTTTGYVGESARHNAEVFTHDGFFRTGDLGTLDAGGSLTFTGRSHEMIKRSGINVAPADVEEALLRHPEVAMVGVTGTPDPRWDEAIIAFVVPVPGGQRNPKVLLEHCRDLLSRYKWPDHIELCDSLPLTATGKLLRRELKALAANLPRA